MIKKVLTRLLSASGLFLVACGSPSLDEGRLLPADEEPYNASTEEKRLQEMQYLHVVGSDGKSEVWDLDEWMPGVSIQVDNVCAAPPGLPVSAQFSYCDIRSMRQEFELWMPIVTGGALSRSIFVYRPDAAVRGPLAWSESSMTTANLELSVPPQSVATRAKIAQKLVEFFTTILEEARALEDRGIGRDEVTSLLGLLIAQFDELVEWRTSLTLGVADMQQGSSTQASLSLARGLSGAELSRAAIAHFLVGGAKGIEGKTATPLCKSGMSYSVKKAIALIRSLAPAPSDIIAVANGTVSLGDFVRKVGTTDGIDSLTERYAAVHAVPVENIETETGLSMTDFGQAVEYLAEEILLYDLPDLVLSHPIGQGVNTYSAYAATAHGPGRLPPVFWTAIARSSAEVDESSSPATYVPNIVPNNISRIDNPEDGGSWTERSAVDTLSALVYRVSTYVQSDPPWPGMEAYPGLATLLSNSDQLGFFQHHEFEDGDSYRVMLFRPDNRRFFLALGDDALRCAVMGDLYGTKCKPFVALDSNDAVSSSGYDLTPGKIVEFTKDPSPLGAYAQTMGVVDRNVSGNRRVYLLASKGALPARPQEPESADVDPWAGKLDAVLGIVPMRTTPYSTTEGEDSRLQINYYGIVPKWEKMAGEVMARSPEDCSRPVLECAAGQLNGTGVFDERLPLENELSADDDGFENSWKYYLTQARKAATESDTRTKEYIDSSLNNDLRVESVQEKRQAQMEKAAQELERLQSICGTSVAIDTLLKTIGVKTSSQDADGDGVIDEWDLDWGVSAGRSFECDPQGTLDFGELCINGRKVVLWEQLLRDGDSEMLKLQSCIQNFEEVLDKVHFSTEPICIFTQEDRPPVPLQANLSCPSGSQKLGVDKSFQWYTLADRSVTDMGGETCAAVREMRDSIESGSTSLSVSNAIRESKIYNPSALRDLRSYISVESKIGGFVDVKLGGKSWITTGSPHSGGNSDSWPCAVDSSSSGTCATSGTSSFKCDFYSCTDEQSRALLNDRLLDAFLALDLISQGGADDRDMEIWLPFLIPKSITPIGYARRPVKVIDANEDEYLVDERLNSLVKTYWFNDVPPSDYNAFIRHGLPISIEGDYQGQMPGVPGAGYVANFRYKFGLARNKPPMLPTRTVDGFFGGLGRSSDSNGYFAARLISGKEHSEAFEATAKTIPWWWIDRVGFPSNAYMFGAFPGVSSFCGNGGLYDQEGANEYLSSHGLAVAWDIQTPDSRDFSDPSISYEDELCSGQAPVVAFPAEPEDFNWPLIPHNLPSYLTQDDGIRLRTQLAIDVNEQALLDAFELVCEANEALVKGISCAEPPPVTSVHDLPDMATYLQCQGDVISNHLAGTVLTNVPDAVFRDLTGGNPAVAAVGEMGSAASELREALGAINDGQSEFRRIFDGFAIEMRQLSSRIKIEELENKLTELNFASTVSNQIATCGAAVGEASGWAKNISTFGSHWAGVAHVCANSVAQTIIASKVKNIEQEINEEQRKIIFGDGETEFIRLEKALATESSNMIAAAERVQRTLGRMEDLRDEARRSVDQALWHLSFQSEKAAVINNVMKSETRTAHTRYVRAHTNAKRWASLARRAIEQRLGVDLAGVVDDLPLVEAPQRWVSSVCATSPVDYRELGNVNGDYTDSFIGDYVTKLENVVESYRLTFGFQDGSDTAVVSLRDDVLNLRQECEVPSDNLLFHAAEFGSATPIAQTEPGTWQLVDCPKPTDVGQSGLGIEALCVATTKVDSPFQVPVSREEHVSGFEIQFGDGENPSCTDCELEDDSRLTQSVELNLGAYRFSWYSPPELDTSGAAISGLGQHVGGVWDEEGTPIAGLTTATRLPGLVINGEIISWDRYFVEFDVASSGVYSVGFSRPSSGDYDPLDYMKYEVGAPMLERANTSVNADGKPTPFSNTGDTLTEMRYACEDRDGTEFRNGWTRACERVCPSDSGSICPSTAVEQCYWENSFYIDQRSIASGRILNASGFARGNFNYRIEGIALNFVGTGIRACEQSETASACFGGGFVPYSLYHTGPFMVHNHFGYDYEAKLFDGVIEHARGLGTERYISNPIGTEDKEMLLDYTRTEYQGRPLDGGFTIRVWEEDGIDFSAIEDVQVILNYRYWSR